MPSKWAMEVAMNALFDGLPERIDPIPRKATLAVADAIDAARREALEEAALAVLNGFDDNTAARAIRALIEKETDR